MKFTFFRSIANLLVMALLVFQGANALAYPACDAHFVSVNFCHSANAPGRIIEAAQLAVTTFQIVQNSAGPKCDRIGNLVASVYYSDYKLGNTLRERITDQGQVSALNSASFQQILPHTTSGSASNPVVVVNFESSINGVVVTAKTTDGSVISDNPVSCSRSTNPADNIWN